MSDTQNSQGSTIAIDPDKPSLWPTSVTENDVIRTITRVVVINVPNQEAQTTTQSVTFKRSGTYDSDTSTITWSDWSENGKHKFEEIEIPEVAGYDPSVKQIPMIYVTPMSKSTAITVSYTQHSNTVNTFSDAQSPYLNKYNAAKRYSKVLFRPGRPAFSAELLEAQSIQNNQLAMLGDSLFQEGAIISGMDIIPQPDNQATTSGMPNTFSVASLFANRTALDTGLYTNSGIISVKSQAVMPDDEVGFDFTGNATKGLNMTVSFTIRKTSGTLSRVNLRYDTDALTATSWTIDDTPVLNGVNEFVAGNLSGSNGTNNTGVPFNLDDGEAHKVVVHFQTKESGITKFSMVLNAGYDSTQMPFSVEIGKLYVEDGDKATDWEINESDTGTPSDTDRIKHYTVTAGRVWLSGAVRKFDQQDFSIKGTGKEEIGLQLQENVVTANDDPDLLDDTPNAVTRGEAGADRLHYSVVLTYNDPSATSFVVFQDNVINPRAVKPDYSNLEPILARRTFDQSGSFRSYGFEGHMRRNPDPAKGAQDPDDSSKIMMDIDAGQAYVRGYSISTSKPTTLRFDTAKDDAQQINEGYPYIENQPIYLHNQPVKEIDNVTMIGQKDIEINNASGSGVTDEIPGYNVIYIHTIYDENHPVTTPYRAGIDYTYAGNKIYWGTDPNGKALTGGNNEHPTPGASYHVVFDYSYNGQLGTDYAVKTDENNKTYLEILTGTNTPKLGSVVNITYNYFSARIDMIRITMDQSNPFKIIKGDPAPLDSVTPPVVNDPLTLELGYVLIQPNSYKATFTMQTTTRITFKTLQQWGVRLTNTESNIAIERLHEQVKRSEDPKVLKDAFADNFTNAFGTDGTNTSVDFDFENGEIGVPAQAMADLRPKADFDISQVAIKGHLITPPYHEANAIDQPLWTGISYVNEYNVFTTNGTLTIDPSTDNWIDVGAARTKFSTVHEQQPVNIHKWWRHTNPADKSYWGNNAILYEKNEAQWDQLAGLYDPGSGNTLGETGWTIADAGSTTTKTSINYMRSNKVHFIAKNFRPFKDGFRITIDGTPVQKPTPDSNTYASKVYNEFMTDAKGEIHGSFVIPGGTILTGTRTVTIYNDDGDQAATQYTANGTLMTTTNNIEKRIYTVNLIDPLAESFYLPQTRQLSSIDLYFASKPDVGDMAVHRPQLIVQLREVSDDGFPNRTVRSQVFIDPDQIHTSDDATVATHIIFPDSVTLNAGQGYAICLLSDSDQYSVFSATQGEKVQNKDQASSTTVYETLPDGIDYQNKDPEATNGTNWTIQSKVTAKYGDILKKTPNSNGDMFISNNGMTWKPDGGSSIKFRVNVAEYQSDGEILFDPIDLSNFKAESTDNTGTPILDNNKQPTGSYSIWAMDKGPNMDGTQATPVSALKMMDRLAALTEFLTYQNTSMHWFIKVLSQDELNAIGGTDPLQVIQSDNIPWQPLNVNNQNQITDAPGANVYNLPDITDNNTPQSVDGELSLFQQSIAIQLKARFDSDRYIAPVLTTENLSLAACLTGKQAEYESVNLDESGDAHFNKVRLEFDGYIPAVGTDVPQINPMYSVDGGQTWLNFKVDGSVSDTIEKDSSDTSRPIKTKQMSAYFTRYTYEAKVPNTSDENHLATQFKIRLKLTAPTNWRTPRVRQLTAVCEYEPVDSK